MATLLLASSPNELRQQLAALDIAVPRRTAGRTTQQTERYAIGHLLASFPCNHLAYPLSVEHRERPDFVMAVGGRLTGIEHTEAIAENTAHASALRERGAGSPLHFMQRAQPGEPAKNSQQLLQEIELERPGPPWVGDEPEREWAQAMHYFAEVKVEKSRRPGYELFERNWLLMYDNWSVPAVKYTRASGLFHAQCVASAVFETFERLFVLGSKSLCEVSLQQHQVFPLVSPRVGS